MPNKIFVNLPVKDLAASMQFFGALGFSFNEQYTDEQAACMIVSDDIFVMLLTEGFFQTFINKEIADTTKTTEVLTALAMESREAVDTLVGAALEAGATEVREPQDHEVMYTRTFEDLDGHTWEIMTMKAGGEDGAEEGADEKTTEESVPQTS